MTRAKRVEKLKHFITCLKCEVSGKCCDNNCPTQYNAGNMGEIIENLEEIAKALEQEPTTKNDLGVDCISRAEAIKCLECDFDITGKENMKTVVNYINSAHDKIVNLPRVKQEPKTGHWILDETDNSITCDKCGCLIWANDISNGEAYYCPHCGAKMAETEADNGEID